VRVGNGHFACDGGEDVGLPHSHLCREITESVFRIRSWAKIWERTNRVSLPEMNRAAY
jgi:hypothetical protein